jgi:hypothetical protein
MLTFEEFFIKKKIDLAQLQQAEPALFAEFKKDFEPMGEKSFDHTKKFWFNKLRRLYHLKEEPKSPKTEIEMTEVASQAEPLTSPSIEQQPAYTPRFKPAAIKSQEITKSDAIEVTAQEENPKPAYQPRFKMQTAVLKTGSEDKPTELPDAELQQAQSKPAAYKPKFNMKTVATQKPQSEVKADDMLAQNPESPKPSYKPKFNMKNIKPKSEE